MSLLLAAPAPAFGQGLPPKGSVLDPAETARRSARWLDRTLQALFVLSAGPGIGGGRYRLHDVHVTATRISPNLTWPPRRTYRKRPPPSPEEGGAEVGDAGEPGQAPTGGGPLAPDADWDRVEDEGAPDLRLRLRLGIGLTESEQPIRELGKFGVSGGVAVSADSYQFGLGVDFRLGEMARLSPVVHVAWTHATSRAYGDTLSRVILGYYFDESLVNWRLEAISVIPALEGALGIPLGPVRLELLVQAAYLHSRTISSSSPVLDVSADSGLLRSSLAVDVPLGIELFGLPLRVKPGLAHMFLAGSLREGVGTGQLLEPFLWVLAESVALIPWLFGRDDLPLMTELGVSVNLVLGRRVLGWNVGAGVAFEF